jgi:NAD(P)-dependent dehydrogenase (short-subunit alcohol dehydrogenase family)
MLNRIVDTSPGLKGQMNAQYSIGRVAQPEEIAKAVLYLCSERATFVTGYELMAEGGFTAQ